MWFGVGKSRSIDIPASWKFDECLGTGSIGVVVSLVDEKGQKTAVKRSYIGSYDEANRLMRDVQLLRGLQYKHLLAWHVSGSTDREVFLAGPYMTVNLRKFLSNGPHSSKLSARLSAELMLGLHCLHAAGVVHGNLTPANILLDGCGP